MPQMLDSTNYKIIKRYVLSWSGDDLSQKCHQNTTSQNVTQYESGKKLWLQPWWQQLHPDSFSWSRLAVDTSSLDCLWDINTCSKCCLSALNSPKIGCVHHEHHNASASIGLQSCLKEPFPEWYRWASKRGKWQANRLASPLAVKSKESCCTKYLI